MRRPRLEGAPREPEPPTVPTTPRGTNDGATFGDATFGDAVDAWLSYVEHEKQRKPSTLRDNRNVARHDLLPRFGAETPMRRVVRGRIVGDTFTEDDIESF